MQNWGDKVNKFIKKMGECISSVRRVTIRKGKQMRNASITGQNVGHRGGE